MSAIKQNDPQQANTRYRGFCQKKKKKRENSILVTWLSTSFLKNKHDLKDVYYRAARRDLSETSFYQTRIN